MTDSNAALCNTILFAEDDERILRPVTMILEHNGYTVLAATNGTDALGALAESPDDIRLVILDLSLPDMDGLEVLAEIRRKFPGTKVIVTTGLDPDMRALPEHVRPDGLILKPYTTQALLEHMLRLLPPSP